MAIRRSSLGNELTRVSYRLKLSDGEVAARAGISRAQLNRIRNGHSIPRLGTAILLSRALACRVAELFYLPSSSPGTKAKFVKRGRSLRGVSGFSSSPG